MRKGGTQSLKGGSTEVPPAYAEHCRAVAQQFGFGRKKAEAGEVAPRNREEPATVGAPELQAPLSPSSPKRVGKERGASAEKKSGGARSAKAGAAHEGSATPSASLPAAVGQTHHRMLPWYRVARVLKMSQPRRLKM